MSIPPKHTSPATRPEAGSGVAPFSVADPAGVRNAASPVNQYPCLLLQRSDGRRHLLLQPARWLKEPI